VTAILLSTAVLTTHGFTIITPSHDRITKPTRTRNQSINKGPNAAAALKKLAWTRTRDDSLHDSISYKKKRTAEKACGRPPQGFYNPIIIFHFHFQAEINLERRKDAAWPLPTSAQLTPNLVSRRHGLIDIVTDETKAGLSSAPCARLLARNLLHPRDLILGIEEREKRVIPGN